MTWWNIYRQGLLVGIADLRQFWTLRSWFFAWLVRVLTNAFAWVLLGRVAGSEDKVHYLLVGHAVAAGASAALWASNATTWSRWDGTHPLLVIAPGSLLAAVIGRTSVWLLNGMATSLMSFIVLFAAFGVVPQPSAALASLGVVLLVCTSAFGFALWTGAWLSNRGRFRNIALDLSSMILVAICGVSVPVEFWPRPVQWIANAIPMTHGLAAIRLILGHGAHGSIAWQIALEVAVASGWLLLSLLTMTRLFNGGRADGSIELV